MIRGYWLVVTPFHVNENQEGLGASNLDAVLNITTTRLVKVADSGSHGTSRPFRYY